MDPVSPEFWDAWNARAAQNSKFYRDVFKAEPDDLFDSYKTLVKYRKEQEAKTVEDFLEEYNLRKHEVVGHIVEYPHNFLKNESLKLLMTDIENYVPDISFT